MVYSNTTASVSPYLCIKVFSDNSLPIRPHSKDKLAPSCRVWAPSASYPPAAEEQKLSSVVKAWCIVRVPRMSVGMFRHADWSVVTINITGGFDSSGGLLYVSVAGQERPPGLSTPAGSLNGWSKKERERERGRVHRAGQERTCVWATWASTDVGWSVIGPWRPVPASFLAAALNERLERWVTPLQN